MELIYVAYADNMVSDRAGRGDAVQKKQPKMLSHDIKQ